MANPQGDADHDYRELLNPKSLETVKGRVEPSLGTARPGDRFQFERLGYFCVDPDATEDALAFNRIVTLRDSWRKIVQRGDDHGEPRRPRRTQVTPKRRAKSHAEGKAPPDADLTAAQRSRLDHYRDQLGLTARDAFLLASDDALALFFEKALRNHNNSTGVANWIINELRPGLNEKSLDSLPLTPEGLAELVALIDRQTISGKGR